MNQPSPTTPLIFRTGMGEKNGKSKLPEKSTDFVDDGVYRQTGVEKWVNTLLCRGDLAKESFQAKPVGVLDLFKYAEEHDRLLILIGLTSSIITGAVQALVAVMAGKLATALIESDQGKITKDEMWDRGFFMVKMNICVGVIVIATSLITNYCFKLAAKNIAAHLRSRFIKSILRQDAQWFDQQKFGALNTQLNDNISRIHDGIGDKVGLLIRCMCQLIVTLIVCFVIDWRITASMIVSAPLSCLIMSSMARMISSSTAKQLPLLDKSGAILQETIMNVKTVQSCNGQQEMIKKYHDSLLAARIHGILIGVWQGLFDGMFFVVIYVFFAIGLVYGGYLYYMDEIASGDVFIITTMLTMSVYFVGFISPHIMSVFKARVSAAIIYQQIERIPDIDCYNDYGEELPNCKGHIKFEDVKFAYPNRKDRQVLKGVTWEARPSETVALVGHSGCGKSTSISLLTRLYDVTAGKITIDGVDIRNLKITTLRQIIGIVQQEPVLFNGSIFENIKLGDDSITMDKAERACRMANAHDFIQKLEHGYNTNIGSGEIQLSGGQKQRIAIARAIVNNPPILLLDEATSALDAESEIHVQQALKHATQGRTTIVIAHRLSTLRDVQKIIVYDSGAVVEIGSHVELSEKEGGLYSSLVKHQQFKSVDKEQTNEEPMVMKRKETLRGSSLMSRDSVSVPDLGAEIAAEEPEYTDRKPRYGLLTLYKNCQGEYVKFITGAIFCCVRGMELVFYVVGLTLLFDAFRNKEVPWEQFAVGLELVGWFNVALGFYALIAILGSLAFLNWAGENVLIKLKVRALSTILSQGAAYFDRPQTSPPKLVQRITNDSLNCKAAMDIRLYHVLNNAFCTFMQFIVTFAMSWHIGVVGTILYIAILAVLGCMARMMQDGIRAVQKRDDSPKLAVEIIENTKTIQLLTREKYFAEKYDQSLEAPESEEKKVIWADSVTFSITQSAMYLSDVICYSCALWMIYYWDADVTRMFMACNTMSTMSWSILFISISLVEMMHAAPATNSLFSIFGEDLCVDANEEYGETPKVMGNVVAEKVFFSYPTRPDITVTNGLNVKALAGETIALVGPSGGGKSTIINLLQRFYEPKSGNVSVDGNAINSFKLSYLRSEMALVGQEPVLFSGTIYENATLGMEDVDPHWVMEAFELANAKKFIENLPEGYDTEVGEKGAQLSGGQKQRVAIARALVRRPKILLLDEATSALDAESERAVQQALDTAASGRTCITIAHRLSSIQHADKIYFISNGRVTEVGTHAELMNADGAYADMIRKQDLQSTAEN